MGAETARSGLSVTADCATDATRKSSNPILRFIIQTLLHRTHRAPSRGGSDADEDTLRKFVLLCEPVVRNLHRGSARRHLGERADISWIELGHRRAFARRS